MTKGAFDKIAEGLTDAIAIARGEVEAPRMYVPPSVDVAAIRKRTKLSQEKLARLGAKAEKPRPGSPDPSSRHRSGA